MIAVKTFSLFLTNEFNFQIKTKVYTKNIDQLNAWEGHNYSCHLFECELDSPVYSYHHFLVWSKNHENMRTYIRNAYFTLLHYDVMGAYHAITVYVLL